MYPSGVKKIFRTFGRYIETIQPTFPLLLRTPFVIFDKVCELCFRPTNQLTAAEDTSTGINLSTSDDDTAGNNVTDDDTPGPSSRHVVQSHIIPEGSMCSTASSGSSVSTTQFQRKMKIAHRALYLWRAMRNDRVFANSVWRQMDKLEKLPYIWASMANQKLSVKPFDNFKYSIAGGKKLTKRRINKLKHVFYKKLGDEQRMPFVMEAVIAKLMLGEINLNNRSEVISIFNKLLNFGKGSGRMHKGGMKGQQGM
ncbi:uncharacterized protein LOC119689680 [Teleopsis dalmanni]|uniref:uncharacterized protein LOC119689680 n=1 Tax=Teleopsis dalmanni TaxID=139649 RepID=UPI0018CF50B4|nr:uncharacterized protein LOC119689680 [Teleopsis dalmanni]